MTLTNAEKQQRYRAWRDSGPLRRARYLKQKKEKCVQDLLVGKRVPINDLLERYKRQLRKKWRKNKKEYRKKQKKLQNNVGDLTPPMFPNGDSIPQAPTYQQLSNTKRKKRSQAKCYRDNEKLTIQLMLEKVKYT